MTQQHAPAFVSITAPTAPPPMLHLPVTTSQAYMPTYDQRQDTAPRHRHPSFPLPPPGCYTYLSPHPKHTCSHMPTDRTPLLGIGVHHCPYHALDAKQTCHHIPGIHAHTCPPTGHRSPTLASIICPPHASDVTRMHYHIPSIDDQ